MYIVEISIVYIILMVNHVFGRRPSHPRHPPVAVAGCGEPTERQESGGWHVERKGGSQDGETTGASTGSRGDGFVWSKYSKKKGEILNLELISERFGVSSFDVTFVAGKCFIDLIQSKMSRKLKFISQISETGRC